MFFQPRSLAHSIAPNGERYQPTIKPTPDFSAHADAQKLMKAMQGLGTDEQAIIDILGRRTSAERKAICEVYQSTFNKSLHDSLKKKLFGEFKKLALVLIQSPFEVMADALYNAMKGLGTNERVLNELVASCVKDDIAPLKRAYEKGENRSLEKDIQGDTSGSYCKALLMLLASQHDDLSAYQLQELNQENINEIIDLQMAESDATDVYDFGEGRSSKADERFMRPILTRSLWQLNALNNAYIQKYGHPLVEAIEKATSWDFKHILIARVKYATDRPAFYAEIFNGALRGLGTENNTLQRNLALRAEIDLETIKAKYEELYGESLENAVANDTSGDYRKLCLKLLMTSDDP